MRGRRRVQPQLASSLELAGWTTPTNLPFVAAPSATAGRDSSKVLADHENNAIRITNREIAHVIGPICGFDNHLGPSLDDFSFHVPPNALSTGAIFWAAPPATLTLIRSTGVRKPIHLLSGDQNG